MQYSFPVPEIDNDDLEETAAQPRVHHRQSLTPEAVSAEVERILSQYSESTVRGYKQDMAAWWAFCNKNVSATTDKDVLSYLKHLEAEGYSNATINRRIASLSKVFSIYVSLGLIAANPVQTLGSITRIYRPVDPQVEQTVTMHDVEAVVSKARPRTALVVKFLANTGLRVSELTGIQKTDLEAYDTEFMRVRVHGKGNKTRFIFIPYPLYQEVKAVFDSESEYLFSTRTANRISRINLYKQIRRAFEQHAGRKGVTCHSLRHFFATQKIVVEKKDFKAVSRYLGHSNVGITLDLYTHSTLAPEDTQIVT